MTTPVLFGMTVVGLLLLFSNIWLSESTVVRLVVGVVGPFLAIYG